MVQTMADKALVQEFVSSFPSIKKICLPPPPPQAASHPRKVEISSGTFAAVFCEKINLYQAVVQFCVPYFHDS